MGAHWFKEHESYTLGKVRLACSLCVNGNDGSSQQNWGILLSYLLLVKLSTCGKTKRRAKWRLICPCASDFSSWFPSMMIESFVVFTWSSCGVKWCTSKCIANRFGSLWTWNNYRTLKMQQKDTYKTNLTSSIVPNADSRLSKLWWYKGAIANGQSHTGDSIFFLLSFLYVSIYAKNWTAEWSKRIIQLNARFIYHQPRANPINNKQ